MSKMYAWALSGLIIGSPALACDDDAFQSCREEFSNAARSIMRMESESDRAQTAGDAVRNCWKCAIESVQNRVHSFSGSSSGRR